MTPFKKLPESSFSRSDEDVEDLSDPGGSPDDDSSLVEEQAPAEYVSFRLDRESYALPIGALREIVKVSPLTEVPRAAPSLLGVMNLRGQVLPVFSLKRRLGFADEPARIAGPEADLASVPRSARILVVLTPEGDAGVVVDAVQGVVRMQPSLFVEADSGEARTGIAGCARHREELVRLLELETLLRMET